MTYRPENDEQFEQSSQYQTSQQAERPVHPNYGQQPTTDPQYGYQPQQTPVRRREPEQNWFQKHPLQAGCLGLLFAMTFCLGGAILAILGNYAFSNPFANVLPTQMTTVDPNAGAGAQPVTGTTGNMTFQDMDAYCRGLGLTVYQKADGTLGCDKGTNLTNQLAPPVATQCLASGTIQQLQNTQATNTNTPSWDAKYDSNWRTGDEEGDVYPFYPDRIYLVIGTMEAQTGVHLVVMCNSDTEIQMQVVDAEVIPSTQGQLFTSVYNDFIELSGFKAAVQGRASMPVFIRYY